MTLLRSALVATCLTLAAVAAHADLLDDIMKARKIRISTDMAIPPAGMMDGNMQPTGSDATELEEALAGFVNVLAFWVRVSAREAGAGSIPGGRAH